MSRRRKAAARRKKYARTSSSSVPGRRSELAAQWYALALEEAGPGRETWVREAFEAKLVTEAEALRALADTADVVAIVLVIARNE